MKSYKPLDNLVKGVGNYIQNNSEKIWKGAKYLVIFPTALIVALNVLPKFQNTINKIIPTASTNLSQVDAAEAKTNVLDYFHNALKSRDEKIAENQILREEKTLEDYLSKNLKRSFRIVDLEGSKQIPRDYNFSNVQKEDLDYKLLKELNLYSHMRLSYEILNVNGQKVWVYNVIDSDNINDGKILVSDLIDDRVRVLFDKMNKSSINLASSGLRTYDIEAVMCDIIKSKARDYNLYRISDGTTFGFVLAPKKLAIEEILKEYDSFNGAILGSPFKSKEKALVVIITPEEEVEEVPEEEALVTTTTTLTTTTTTLTPQQSPGQELNDNNDLQDPVNTGSDPNTGEGSTQETPVVNPDTLPHEF